ncbi:MAG: ROK family protein [Acidobacteria bacterium]|jgi:glucokinase|nr:ROK family protein [Acidobacteriota bacterium]
MSLDEDESDLDGIQPPLALGVDVGGTSTKAGLVDVGGNVHAFTRFPTEGHHSPEPFMGRLKECVGGLLERAPVEVKGVGLSVHGWTDDDRKGPILCLNTPALHGVDMKTPLGEWFGLPVVVNNDLTAHVLAEYAYGVGKGAARFLCLALGTGLGAGVVVGGEPLRYVGGCAGDTGHVILEPGGPACTTGCRGCAEALCGVEGIERLARQEYGRSVTARDVITAAREGTDEKAIAVIRQIGRYVGETLASLSVIYLPDRMALTGGTAEAGPVLLDAVRERWEELVGEYHRTFAGMPGDYYSGTEIVFGRTRGETGVVGAVVELLRPARRPV